MKKLLCLILLCLSSAAFAGTVALPEPTVVSVDPGAYCFEQETLNHATSPYAHQEAIGWIDDTHVAVYAYGNLPCGNRYGGRGLRYYPFSVELVWTVDANGNPTGPAAVANVAVAPAPLSPTNSVGYLIEVQTVCNSNPYLGCEYRTFWPVVITP